MESSTNAVGTRRRLTRVGLIAGAALGVTLAVGTTVSNATPNVGAAAPTITVTPSSGLSDGQSVTVVGSGLNPGDVYHVGECAAVNPTTYACAPTNVDVTAGTDGSLTTPLTVLKSFTGHTVDGTMVPMDCAETQCVVGVFTSSFSGGEARISFS